MSWIPLHVHSQYSILDATASIKGLVNRAAQLEMKALALTDHGNLFGAVEFYKACTAKGVKPLIGIDLYVAPSSRLEKKKQPGLPPGFSLVLIAKDAVGYRNLCKLSSHGYLEGFYYYPRVDDELLSEYSAGLICLSSGVNGQLGSLALKGDEEELKARIQWFQQLYGEDFYLELQRHQMDTEAISEGGLQQETWLLQQYQQYIDRQSQVNETFVQLARKEGIPYVATNDSHYLERSDWKAHEILLNVQSGEPCEVWEKDSQGNPKFRIPNPKRHSYPSHEFDFKSPDEMSLRFQDLPEAISTTLAVAEKCSLELDFETKHYPVYLPPDLETPPKDSTEGAALVEAFLRKRCALGIEERYTPERLEKVQEKYPNRDPLDVVRERLEYELSVVVPKGLADYLLIVWDFIHWAKKQGIPVGPGRGSGAGSIILYLIGVTDIEPLRFNLFFERFINPERMSYPDIDVDICMDQRGTVIDYTVGKYGKDNVAQIITFGTMKAKMVIKDVGRVLSVPLSKVNAIAKLVPEELGITLDKALEIDPELAQQAESDEDTKRIIDYGRRLEGSIRNTGIHAAGIIISGEPLTEHIPICRAKDSDLASTQYSMKPVEAVGMLKVDFLGLKTLTSIQICVNALKSLRGIDIDWTSLPLEDEPTFALLNQGLTLGVFQMESGGMQDLARQLHLDRFEEIIAVVSLYRPGPMDMIPSFIARKHGREPIEYDHEWMKDILEETYGIMVYQEQVMMIAQKLANFSLGEGDVLRRAMGKKDAEQMAEMREKFREGARENNIDDALSMQIFDKMEKFAAYGFNKSHAAAYGYITYVTAYLKANYPQEWMAALMTCDRDDITKVSKFIGECQAMNIPILPPDVNEAGTEFTATGQGVRFAITAIKGVGAGVVDTILAERQHEGHFKNLYDFMSRVDGKKVGKKVIEALVEAGCFDFTGWTREQLCQSIEPMYDTAQREQKDKSLGAMSLFDLIDEGNEGAFAKPPEVSQPRSRLQILLKEKELLGFFLTGHPMDTYKPILKQLSCVPLKQVEHLEHDAVFRAAFIVEKAQVKIASRSQKKFAILQISDGVDRYELPVWPELYEKNSHLLGENQLLYAVLHLEKQEGAVKLSCRWLDDLTQASETMLRACDEAFDREKLRIQKFAQRRAASKDRGNVQKKGEKLVEKKPEPTVLRLAVDVQNARLSHILKLKELLSTQSGSSSLEVDFCLSNRTIATLHLDARYGVTDSESLNKQLKQLPICVR